MPNAFSFVALFLWPLVTLVLFRMLSRPYALIASILGGYLLLPFGVGIDLPMLPTLDKTFIPAASALLAVLFVGERRKTRRAAPIGPDDASQPAPPASSGRRIVASRDPRLARASSESGSGFGRAIEYLLLGLLFVNPLATALTNADAVIAGRRVLPGLVTYDALSMVLTAFVAVLPYLLARRYLGRPEDQRHLLIGLAIAGLLYSIPALIEARLSPQLSRMVYGFLAQSFIQAMRDGGYRPVVFLQHGLWLAIFLAMSILAAFVLWRRRKSPWLAIGLWLLVTLVLCRSLGALAIALISLPIVLLVPARGQLIVASIIASAIVLYPVLRGSGVVPVEQIAAVVDVVSVDRGDSLQFRLDNEDRLLSHANERPLAGWGIWGRSRVYDRRGDDVSTVDGMWILTIGQSGWLGYVAQFGLLSAPILVLAFRRRAQVTLETAGLAVVLVANLVDMIPNATLTPVSWLVAGSLAGSYARRVSVGAQARAPADTNNWRRQRPAEEAAVSYTKAPVGDRSVPGRPRT